MASIQTSSYDGRYLKLTVTEESYSIADNTSTVKWVLESLGGNSNYYNIYEAKVTINDSVVYGPTSKTWDTRVFPAAKGSTSGTIVIPHNADGTAPDVSFVLRGSVYNNSPKNYSGSIPLTAIPRQASLNSAPDFNDENNPKITYSNPAGNSVNLLQACISLTGAVADIAYRDISKTGNEYTFVLTDSERDILRNNCTNANSRTVVFIIKTVIGNNTFYSSLVKTLSIVNANPTAGSLSYADISSTISAITGNNQHIVRNNSSLRVTYGAATAKKGANISNYKITFNGSTQTKNSAGYIDYGIVNISSSTTVTVVATDSRGNTVSISKNITIYDWILPSAVISLKRVNNYEDTTKLKVQVTISSVNNKNAILSIKHRSKKTSDSNYSSWSSSLNNNTEYTLTKEKAYAWDFQIEIKDKFGTTTYNLVLGKGVPIWYLDIKNLAVGINAYPSSGETLKVDGNTNIVGNLNISGKHNTDYSSLSGAVGTGMVRFIPKTSYTASSLNTGTDTNDFIKGFLKWLCNTYPNDTYTTYIGQIEPNAQGTIIVHIYNNSRKNSSTGLPEYSSGIYINLGRTLEFNTNSYTYASYQHARTSEIPTTTDINNLINTKINDKVQYGTSLPSSADNGTIFLLYS